MPPANPSGFFHLEERLDVGAIADIQQIRTGTADIVFDEEHEYQGILLVSVAVKRKGANASKRQRLEFRAVVLGQSQSEPGKVALYTRPNKVFQTVIGTEMKQSGGVGIGSIHWCSGLQLKWVPHVTATTRVQTGLFQEKAVHDARVKLAKDLFEMLDEEQEWSDIDWDEIETMINGIQCQLDVTNSPKRRQQKRGGAGGTSKKNKEPPAKESTPISQEEPSSVNLDDEAKIRVKTLMTEYMTKEPSEFRKHDRELTMLLNKAFVTHFDISILKNFAKAREVNLDLFSLHTFASFAAWWKQNEAGSHSCSCACPHGHSTGPPASAGIVSDTRVPAGESFLERCKNMFAYVFRGT
ncbi:hypothetical protein QM012_008770 [Aureobasidium pullulans]|uniref:Uncharacterized protein n=1 Tax=Aureobasidium pullulans TaxID=5580 RepID=A0ABR0TJ40_AURPU